MLRIAICGTFQVPRIIPSPSVQGIDQRRCLLTKFVGHEKLDVKVIARPCISGLILKYSFVD